MKPFIFLDHLARPYLVFRGWIHYRHPDKEWVTLREISNTELPLYKAIKLPDEQAALYGWPCDVPSTSSPED